jgi:GNAT superfamily N-acetyltransferase
MTVRVAAFAGEYAALAAGTGESEEQLRADEDLHSAQREHWLAWDGPEVVGAVHPWRSPDGRLRLFFDRGRPDAFGPLAAIIGGECFAGFDQDDTAALAALTAVGFTESRREDAYEIPVSLLDVAVPPGIRIVTADRTALEPLAMLDCRLREDVPGADGWQPDLAWFREETYDSPFFDPLTYRVALSGDQYVGLARIWLGPRPVPHLGLIGVLPGHRRRGVARSLIAAAFAPLAGRGVPHVTAEADATNRASATLLTSLGGRITGGSIELHRP